jgi:hypothetical protein
MPAPGAYGPDREIALPIRILSFVWEKEVNGKPTRKTERMMQAINLRYFTL